MAVIFAGSNMDSFIGSARTYTGTAQTRRAGYTSTEIEADVRTNSIGSTFTASIPAVTTGDLWLHFRVKTNATSTSSLADGRMIEILDASGNVLGGLDMNNGNMRAMAGDGGSFGGEYSQDNNTVYTIDLNIAWNGATVSCNLHVDGTTQSSTTTAYALGDATRVVFAMDDLSQANGEFMYFSEIVMDDATSTIGCGLVDMVPDGDGANTAWEGSYTDILAADDTSATSDTAGQVETWTTSYGGPNAGETIRAVVLNTKAVAGVTGPSGVTPVARAGGTNYFGASFDVGAVGIAEWNYAFNVNPNTSAAWAIADFTTAEFGFRSDT